MNLQALNMHSNSLFIGLPLSNPWNNFESLQDCGILKACVSFPGPLSSEPAFPDSRMLPVAGDGEEPGCRVPWLGASAHRWC